jgi:AcrR family transcriptional regulator
VPRTKAAAGSAPISRGAIVTAGVELTQSEGLGAVTMRRLAAELGTWPAALYHHLGDRDAVHDAISDRVVAQFPLPEDSLGWRAWYRALLLGGRIVLRAHPGVARRLMLHGATVPSALRIIDRGVTRLVRAGFGDEAPTAYSLLLNHAVQFIAMEDELPDYTRQRMAMRERFRSLADDTTRPGFAHAGAAFAAMTADDLFTYGVDRLLDGLDTRRRAIVRAKRADGSA